MPPPPPVDSDAAPGAMDPVTIDVVDLTKRFGNAKSTRPPALGGVTIQTHEATRMGIVGESGSGKSTLARIMVGLETPTSGSVTFCGREIRSLKSAERSDFRRAVQLIDQDTSSSFDPRRTLRDAVRRPTQALLGVDRRTGDEMVDETLGIVGLSPEMADRKPHQVSGGQRQRFSIARALVVKPKIIICDEVVSALDVSVQGTVLNFLKRYCTASLAGLIFVSHGLPATAFVSEEIIVMKDGLIVERGTTEEVLFHSNHPYTAQLVQAYHGRRPEPNRVLAEVAVTEGALK